MATREDIERRYSKAAQILQEWGDLGNAWVIHVLYDRDNIYNIDVQDMIERIIIRDPFVLFDAIAKTCQRHMDWASKMAKHEVNAGRAVSAECDEENDYSAACLYERLSEILTHVEKAKEGYVRIRRGNYTKGGGES